MVLLCGKTLIKDESLQLLIAKKFELIIAPSDGDLETILSGNKEISLLLFEIGENHRHSLTILRNLMLSHPRVIVIAVDGDGPEQTIIEAIHCGALDIFRKPYDRTLLVERIESLIHHQI